MKSCRSLVVIACCISLAWPRTSFACINRYGTDLKGEPKMMKEGYPEDYADNLMAKANRKYDWNAEKSELEAKLKETNDYKIRNDYAVAMIFLGETKDAIEVLKQIEEDEPRKYQTATNLGTAYELDGDLTNALVWIKEGITRYKDSHYGSEWLHVKILEAKLALEKDPDWLATNSVLGIDFGKGDVPTEPSSIPNDRFGEARTLQHIEHALHYQLTERLQFVKAPNPIVADLLFDLANVLALNDAAEPAIPVYGFAKSFGCSEIELLDRRISKLKTLVAANPQSGQREGFHGPIRVNSEILVTALVVAAVLGIGIPAVLVWAFLRNRRLRGMESSPSSTES